MKVEKPNTVVKHIGFGVWGFGFGLRIVESEGIGMVKTVSPDIGLRFVSKRKS